MFSSANPHLIYTSQLSHQGRRFSQRLNFTLCFIIIYVIFECLKSHRNSIWCSVGLVQLHTSITPKGCSRWLGLDMLLINGMSTQPVTVRCL